jgi:RNA polymerase sigma factor (sigma-70 family)
MSIAPRSCEDSGESITAVLVKRGNGNLEAAIDILILNDLLERLQTLSPRQARVLEYFGGLDCKKAAQVLGVSAKTVKRHWKRARSWLRIQLAS